LKIGNRCSSQEPAPRGALYAGRCWSLTGWPCVQIGQKLCGRHRSLVNSRPTTCFNNDVGGSRWRPKVAARN
jgi:hypothetical protein